MSEYVHFPEIIPNDRITRARRLEMKSHWISACQKKKKEKGYELKHQSKGYSHANWASFFLSKYDQRVFAMSLF